MKAEVRTLAGGVAVLFLRDVCGSCWWFLVGLLLLS